MHYERNESYLGFDWNAFSNIIGAVGESASNIYTSYTNLEAVRRTTKSETEKARLDAQIAQLQLQATELMAKNAQGANDATMKKILPIALAAGVGLLAIGTMS